MEGPQVCDYDNFYIHIFILYWWGPTRKRLSN